MKTKRIITTALALLALALIPSCGISTPASWKGTPNPLDTPGAQPTASEIRAGHLESITGNRTHHLR